MIPNNHHCEFRRGMTWWTFTYLEERLTTLSRFVALSELNKKTWSEELASLLILSGSAMDTFFRNMNDCPYLKNKQSVLDMEIRVQEHKEEGGFPFWTVDEYRDGFNTIYEFSKNTIIAPFGLDKILKIQPFKAFSDKKVPEWWHAYNDLKHDYYKKIKKKATLNNVVNCMSGLLILNALHLCSQEYLCTHGMIKDKFRHDALPICPEMNNAFRGVPKRYNGYDFSIITKQFVFKLRAVNE